MKNTPFLSILCLSLGLSVIGLVPKATAQPVIVCQIPRSLLCEGCAADLQISIRRNQCRISFNASKSTPGPVVGTVSVRVVHEAIGGTGRRLKRSHRAAETVRAPSGSARCFHFAGKRFCE